MNLFVCILILNLRINYIVVIFLSKLSIYTEFFLIVYT